MEQLQIQMPMDKWELLYREKEEWLGTYMEKVTPFEFYRDLWPVGSFERAGEQDDGKDNGMALSIREKGRAFHTLLTDGLEQLPDLLQENFVITSPIGYYGKRRTGKNARYAYGLAFDLDGVEMPQLRDVDHQMKHGIIPQATYIVNSGRGLHLYYFFDEPIPLTPAMQKGLKEMKYALTKWVIWNRFTSTKKEAEMQGILQGFRMVGSPSKLGPEYPVTAYRWGAGERVSLQYLIEAVPELNDMRKSVERLLNGKRMGLQKAKEQWPEWYQRRVVEKQPRGRWNVKRDLYDWWLRQIRDQITVGHRFYGIMTLAIYATKCNISEEELRADAYGLLQRYDDMSDDEVNRFTEDDIEAALNAYQESYTTFPRDDISKLTAIPIKVNKRNGRKRAQHIVIMNTMKEVKKKLGEHVADGRPSAKQTVADWMALHPNGRKIDCERETGLSRPTVLKWWGKNKS